MADQTKDMQNNANTTSEEKNKDTSNNTQTTQPEEKQKAKTEEEIRAELAKEYEKIADKRVTDALKKREKEYEAQKAKEKMTEEERRRAEEEEKAKKQAQKDYELTIKGLRLDVVDAVAELGLNANFRKLIAVEDLAQIPDEEERKEKLTNRVKEMKELFDKAVADEVEKQKAEFLKGKTPENGDNLKASTVTKYDEYKEAKDVKGMIGEKLNAKPENKK